MKILKMYTFGKGKNKGITLIALVITIIILLILAGITIVQLTGSGLFGKTKIAKQKTRYESAKEIINLKLMEIQVDCEENARVYNIKEIAEGMKLVEDITIEKYYNKETSKIKDDISENLTNLEGIVVSVDEYSEYKFLIGEEGQMVGVLEGEVTDETSKEEFVNIEEFEAKAFSSADITATDSIQYSYEKKRIESNKMQLLITIKDEENGLNKIKYPNGDVLNCNGKNQIGIDYTIECGVEYTFEITSNNGDIKEIIIYEEKLPKNVLFIANKEYTFTCIDTNYQGHKLYLCDEVIPWDNSPTLNTIDYSKSDLRYWLNSNAPENAIEILLEDTNTQDKMFIFSKEENEKYEKFTAIPWEGSSSTGNGSYWTRTYYGQSDWMWARFCDGSLGPRARACYREVGVKPAFVLDN